MKLLDDFYKIEDQSGDESAFNYSVVFNKDHFIYRAHFPGNPVTPGVCIIQMCRELMEHHTGTQLSISKMSVAKFLSVINPAENNAVQASFSKISHTEEGYKFSVLVHDADKQFAKIAMETLIL
ncbi:MAG: hypothetical protein LBS09_09075 [Bacteroidales bacterium]|jgi:3-hydroxyacyl-[acyl-carrier-protein] dehydratase|nr:hypothetical protein [Bacteroidales bacterium]